MNDSQQVNPAAATPDSGPEPLAAGSTNHITATEDRASTLSEIILPLSDIKVDTSIQCRVSINRKTVDDYAACMKNGDIFPPVDAFIVEGSNLLADGFQRIDAARQAGFQSISVRIRQGTRKDAVKFAIAANRAHGVRLSNKDKRRSVQLSFDELEDLSDGAIAQLVGVSQPFVSKLHRQLKTVLSSSARTGRDGKKRGLPKKKQNKTNATANSTAQSTASTDEQAHDADAGQDSEAQTTDENATGRDSTQKDDYDFGNAWHRIKNVLLVELENCPKHLRSQFCQKLRNFAAAVSEITPGITSDSTEHADAVNASLASAPAGAAGSPKAGSATPAKVEGPQSRRARAITVRDHVCRLRDQLDSTTVALRQCQEEKSGFIRNLYDFNARGKAIAILEPVMEKLAGIVASLGNPGNLPFRTHIVLRGSRLNCVRKITEIVTGLAKAIEAPAPKVAQELGNVATELKSPDLRDGLQRLFARRPNTHQRLHKFKNDQTNGKHA
ncbi:MAG TPA: hypothetical protein VGR14_16860 [Verrucomicrobiae bacterium]|jgi:hypothetical protein|nr:hypothetical protein [Verrucomicrobiae bacterium]